MIIRKSILKCCFFVILLAACAPPADQTPTVTPSPAVPVAGLAQVTALDIRQLETFPVQIQLIVSGILPDSCTTIDRIDRSRQDGNFLITLNTLRATGVVCPEAELPFTETFDLDVLDLPAGIYTVQVNGISGTFTLQNDNMSDQSNAVISGRIWHDLCAIGGGEEGQPVTASIGCIRRGEDSYIADGRFDPGESGLGGVVVNLGQGGCPAVGLGSTITDESGVYLFSGLLAGTYCISVDLENAANASLLVPGEWSNTADSSRAEAAVTLTSAENRSDIDFGWDYEFLPALEDLDGGCVDDIEFTADISIPDDTVIAPGQTFTKTWELLNSGTCTWAAAYSMVFVSGDQMGAPDIQPLGQEVEPGQTVELSVTLVAPLEPGNYRGEWKLRNTHGVLFGIGVEADDPFWVQIIAG
jgi:hypothetical protein